MFILVTLADDRISYLKFAKRIDPKGSYHHYSRKVNTSDEYVN